MSQQHVGLGSVSIDLDDGDEMSAARQLLEIGDAANTQNVTRRSNVMYHGFRSIPVSHESNVYRYTSGSSAYQSFGDDQLQSVGVARSHGVAHSFGENQSQSVGVARSHGVAQSFGENQLQSVGVARSYGVAQSFGENQSQSVGVARSYGVAHSFGENQSQSVGVARSYGVAHSFGENQSQSVGVARSHGVVHSFGENQSQSVGVARSHGVAQSFGENQLQSVGVARSHGVAQSFGENQLQSVGVVRSHGVAHSFGENQSQSVGVARSYGVAHSFGENQSQSVGVARSYGVAHSFGENQSQSVGVARSHGVVHSFGENQSQSVGVARSYGVAHSFGENQSQSVGVARSYGISQSTGDRSLLIPHLTISQYKQPKQATTYQPPYPPAPLQPSYPPVSQPPYPPAPLQPPYLDTPQQAAPEPIGSPNRNLLKKTEEDYEIAKQMADRLMASINMETDDMEELYDKREALLRACKRLEERNDKVELRQKKAGLTMDARLKQLEEFEEMTTSVNSALRKLSNKLNRGEPNNAQRRRTQTADTGIRLPKMELKTFDGNVLKWHEFWECFEHGVHNNMTLPDHQKLQYLKNCMKGPAFVTISDLDMKGDHYEVAVKLLQERYGHKNVLRKAHFDGLEKLPVITNTYEMQRLKRFYEELECHYKALLAINVRPEEYSTTMVPKIISKLPIEVRIKLTEQQDENEDLSIGELVEGLRRSVKIMEKCGVQIKERAQGQQKPMQERRRPQQEGHSFRGTISSGATLVSKDSQQKVKCDFCLGEHQSIKCTKYSLPNERKEILKKYKRCFGCLKPGHSIKKCNKSSVCGNCSKGKHNEAICVAEQHAKEPTGIISAKRAWPTASVAYQTVIAKVRSLNGTKEVKCRILLDSGSARSFMTQRLAEEIGSKPLEQGTKQRFEGLNQVFQELQTERHNIHLESLCGSYKTTMEVKTLPKITTVGNPSPVRLKKVYPHLKDVFFTDVTSSKELEVQLLLGSEHLAQIQTGELRKGKMSEPVAVKTMLGWTLMGSTGLAVGKHHDKEPSNLVIEAQKTPKDEVAKLWDLETMGIKEEDPIDMAFQGEIKFNGERYSVPLPWREGRFHVPMNKGLAEGRLKSQLRKLQRTPKVLEEYNEIMLQQLKEGIVEKVPDRPTGDRITYIPHQAVVREEAKTTKVRVVYDASAKTTKGAKSLNECLHTGPSLNPLLYSVILKFRMHNTILMADIKQAFLQIEIDPVDRDALRFLWVKDIKADIPELQELRFTRAIFGAGPSPYILSATIRHHLQKYSDEDAEFVEDVETSLYVDDYISGGNNPEELLQRKEKLQRVFQDGGFCLRKWYSDDPELCKQINEEATNEQRKVLGVVWEPERDELKVDLQIEQPEDKTTKRLLLSCLAAVYDPLGVAGPVILKARLMLQKLCAEGKSWDDTLSEDDEKQFRRWLEDLHEMKYLSMPRFVGQTNDSLGDCRLHVFCDASGVGYCAVVYVVMDTPTGVRSRLLTAKCRLAPLKKLTIPRLELLSATTGAKLANSVLQALKKWNISKLYIWLDSITALYWIANKGVWKPFVNNRVKEIHKLVPEAIWQHCPTNENPSDLGTRGASASKLQHSQLWWEGPDFLKQDKESWPGQHKEFKPTEDAQCEERSPNLLLANEGSTPSLSTTIDIGRFSTLKKLIRVTVRMLRFINNCRNPRNKETGHITAEELQNARTAWVKSVQQELVEEKEFKSRSRNLGAYKHEDGLIRCGGRLKNAQLTFGQRHPILLPTRSKFTELVVMDCHKTAGHEKVGRTLAEIRSEFWIPRGRQVVKSLLMKCHVCKVFSAKHLTAPGMAPLPEMRVTRSRPFQHTGVDFAGPLYVKTDEGKTKSYIALFTCATTRAVHLELTPDLTGPVFRMALEKFAAFWGMPNLIVSDNATTFKTTAIALEKLFEHPEVQSYLQSNFLTWQFNLSLAPWWGGWFEKMVGLTKVILRKTLGKALLRFSEMEVVLRKTQAILNNRPLCYQGEELEEEALTPNHLIFGHRLQQLPDIPEDIFEEDENLATRFKHIESLLNQMWQRWSKEYLIGLREYHKPKTPKTESSYMVKPGDIVLIENKGSQRGMWKKGRVLKLLKGKDDGIVRGVALETIVNGSKRRLERAVQQIYPLEISINQQTKEADNAKEQELRRSSRMAAKNAKAVISTLAEDEFNQLKDD